MAKLHIDTAPVWEAFRQDSECPLCLLHAKVEAANVDYFLGESVMEPDQRIEVNQKGFCGRHFKQMYEIGNRLGLALMTHTHMKETMRSLREDAQKLRDAAATEASRPAISRWVGGRKNGGIQEIADTLSSLDARCVLCERVRESMRRYVYTLLYLYKREPEFAELLAHSKGMCLKHFGETLKMAPEHLSGSALKQFVDRLTEVELANFDRLEGEIDWFTRKFDYRNDDKPWGNSRDAVKRSINKLRTHVIDE